MKVLPNGYLRVYKPWLSLALPPQGGRASVLLVFKCVVCGLRDFPLCLGFQRSMNSMFGFMSGMPRVNLGCTFFRVIVIVAQQ